jgi:hypothetical protein
MDRFIHDENMRHYRSLLERTSDPGERARILALLAEEEARMNSHTAPEPPPGPMRVIVGGRKNQ